MNMYWSPVKEISVSRNYLLISFYSLLKAHNPSSYITQIQKE